MCPRALAAASLPLAVALACRASAPSSPPRPRGDLHATARRVVLLSVDGFAASRHRHLLGQRAYREPAGLAAFEGWGTVVERAIPVDPTLTAVNHATIASGAPPSATGIVCNRFHVPGTGIARSVSGFEAPWGAEALWQSFRRQGRRVGVLYYPSCDGRTPERRADFGAVWIDGALAPPQSLALDAAAFVAAGSPEGAPVSLAPLRRAALPVIFAADSGVPATEFTVVAVDASDDGVTGYDTLLFDDDGNLANGVQARARAGEWFTLTLTGAHPDGGRREIGAWCLLQELAPDLSVVRVYRGGFGATEAYPRSFRERLDREAGFWPGEADGRALERGSAGGTGLQVADFLAQSRHLTDFLAAAARAAIAGETFDLLLAYQPAVDEVQHTFAVADPRQAAYSEGMAATAERAVNETYLMIDTAVADLARALDLTSDALAVVSDHGIAPIWEVVHANEVLRRAGLASAVARGGRQAVAEDSQVVAVTSGGCAHLYVNAVGREPGGVVPPERVEAVVEAAAQAFALLEVGGMPAVEAAYPRRDLGALGLDSANAGDLVLFMRPGVAVSSGIGGATHEPATYSGQHGFRSHHPEMHGVFMARGAAVPRLRRAEASLTEVAAFVSRLAGVQPPRAARPWRP